MPFWTPAGPGGLQPSLTLSYNSQVIDESMAFSQPSWVGMGWSLDAGAIIRNMHETNTDVTDDTFLLSLNGTSSLLLPVDVNGYITSYFTADQSFLKIQQDNTPSALSWTVWGKDGTVYRFDKALVTSKTNGCNPTSDSDRIIWRWSLGSITDKFGNVLTYTYNDVDSKPKSGCSNQLAVYPDTIEYPNQKYRVKFVTEARSDYRSSWLNSISKVLFGLKRLDYIAIQHQNAGAWSTVRRYDFSYAADGSSTNVILPRFSWRGNGERTLTLTRRVISKAGSGIRPQPRWLTITTKITLMP